jgi:hypothetical protein
METILLDHKYYNYGESITITYINSALTSATAETILIKRYSDSVTVFTGTITTDTHGVGSIVIPVVSGTFAAGTTYQVVINSLTDIFRVSYVANLIAGGLDSLLPGFINIPVYSEVGNYKGDGYYQFTFDEWIADIDHIQIRKNNVDLIAYTDYYPDYKGKVYIPNYEAGYEYLASYRFRLFSEADWGDFLQLALDEINACAPMTNFTFISAPTSFDPFLTMRAYIFTLQRILLDIEFWNNRLVFPEPSGLRGTLNTLLVQAIADAKDMKKEAKNRRFLIPKGITSFKISMPYSLSGSNFKQYTVGSIMGDMSSVGVGL